MISEKLVPVLIIGVFASGGPARAAIVDASALTTYEVTPQSTLSYHVTHPLHHVVGVSHQLSGTFQATTQGAGELVLPITLSVPVVSFTSGNANRDRNMLTILDAAAYPSVVLTIATVDWTRHGRAGDDDTATGTAHGTLTLHGLSHPITFPVVGQIGPERMDATAHLSFLLSDYRVSRPSLLFMPIDDRVSVDAQVEAVPARR